MILRVLFGGILTLVGLAGLVQVAFWGSVSRTVTHRYSEHVATSAAPRIIALVASITFLAIGVSLLLRRS